MRKDPRVRKDGRCALPSCRKPRNPKRNPYSGMEPFLDPFCSTNCCREYHGAPRNELPHSMLGPATRIAQWDDGRRRRERIRLAGLQPGHKHSEANYRNGCRCDGCKRAYSERRKQRREAKRQEIAA